MVFEDFGQEKYDSFFGELGKRLKENQFDPKEDNQLGMGEDNEFDPDKGN